MRFRRVVGQYLGRPGSEEAHRRTKDEKPADVPAGVVAAALRRLWGLSGSRRFRLQAAGLVALSLIILLAVLLPARTVRIAVDGGVANMSSRAASGVTLVEQAGIELEPGDVVDSAGNDMIIVRRATEVVLEVDGRTFAVRTQADTVAEVLSEAGIELQPQDSLLRNGAPVSLASPLAVSAQRGQGAEPPAVRLEVRRTVPFSVVENGHELQLRSSRTTVGAALRDVGLRLGPGDEVRPSPSTELTAGVQVRVEHAAPLVVTLPESKVTLYALADTVGEALAESGIELPADYRIEPSPEIPIAAGLAVHVIGISQEQALETERIQSYTVYEPDPSLPPGGQRIVAGQDGVLFRLYTLVFQDDVLVSREIEAEWYDPQPADTVVYYSTAVAPEPPSQPQRPPSGQDWGELVCSYGWDCAWALAVISCESGGNPSAYNPVGPYVGLFQIWEGFGGNLWDPAVNIAAAYSLYQTGGASHWPNCP